MDREGIRYRESGKAPIGGIFKAFTSGLLAVLIVTPIYAFLIHLNPFIYINFLATAILGVVISYYSITKGGKKGNLRNGLIRMLIALILFAIAIYLLWFVKMGILTKDWNPSPDVLWSKIKAVNLLGSWSLRGTVFKGGALWTVWALETLIIFLAIILLTYAAGKEIFCESCNKWLKEYTYFPLSPLTDPKSFKQSAKQGDYNELENLEPIENLGEGATRVKLSCCPECDFTSYVSVTATEHKIVREKAEEKTHDLFENLSISPVKSRAMTVKWKAIEKTEL